RRAHVEAVTRLSIEAGRLLDDLGAALAAGVAPVLPDPAEPDRDRWSRLPGLDLGGPFPIGHQVPGPGTLDERLGLAWAWVVQDASFQPPDDRKVVVEPAATY